MIASGLQRFAWLTAFATLGLIGVGGLVTSHGVGLSVPDWPNTYGYNLFFFPFSRWVGGIFYEHSHRLLASAVGLLTSALALWLYGRTARPLMRRLGLGLLGLGVAAVAAAPKRWPDAIVLAGAGLVLAGSSRHWPRCEASPRCLRRLGLAAFLAVVGQGVLGGLRVVWLKDQIGIFHAALAQVFFALLCVIAWGIARPSGSPREPRPLGSGLRTLMAATTLLVLAQLVLGAAMRHQHAGLAIADFPLAYGKLWPATDPASIALYNQRRLEVVDVNPITAAQVMLQMAHRIVAGLILMGVSVCAWKARRGPVAGLSKVWLGLVVTQVFLGAATIWSGKAADIATAHVMVGALALGCGVLLNCAVQEWGSTAVLALSRRTLIPAPGLTAGAVGGRLGAAAFQPGDSASI